MYFGLVREDIEYKSKNQRHYWKAEAVGIETAGEREEKQRSERKA